MILRCLLVAQVRYELTAANCSYETSIFRPRWPLLSVVELKRQQSDVYAAILSEGEVCHGTVKL